jgi:two-component system response regulator (stage 0 sporulation protein A)
MDSKILHESEITKAISDMGITANLEGYFFLKNAISLRISAPIGPIMKLYSDTANYYSSTPSKVERAIRHAISKIEFGASCNDAVREYLGPIKSLSVPTNSEFVSIVAEYIRNKSRQ